MSRPSPRAATRAAARTDLPAGLVVASHGRHCVVEDAQGQRWICHPRGKKSQAVVGDRVLWQAPPPGQGEEGTIESVQPRKNLFYRQDELRTKSFAANLDCVLILVAAEPEFSEHQLSRALIAAEAEQLRPLIVLNKQDLGSTFERAWERLAPYRRMGYPMLALSLRHAHTDQQLDALRTQLAGQTTLVLGPSGAGKSSLINRLVPGASAHTGEISRALNSGRHTTTSTTWYWMDPAGTAARSALIDSPGFQEFGLHHLDPARLWTCMPDLREHVPHCRFYNCTHRKEPGCAVIGAIGSPETPDGISPYRYQIYCDLFEELSQPPRY